MNDTRKDLPPVSSPNFLEKVREALSVYLGNRGDKLDRGVTLRDLTDSGLVVMNPAYRTGSGGAAPIGGAGPNAGGSYEIDLTPPPIPSGFVATAAISNLLVECSPQTYTQGNGHAKSVLYGATWSAGALPVFSNSVVLTEFSGTVASHATNPSTTWHLWLKWVTVDGVYSTSPAGGTNGVVTRTGEDVETLVAAMTGPGNPFTILATTTVFDGVTFPAGTYSSQAFIQDGQITNAKIKNLSADKINAGSLSASYLSTGSLDVGAYIQSTSYVAGSQGWRINGNGSAEFSGVTVRGTVYASAGQIGGNTIDSSSIRAGQTSYNVGQGFYLGSNGTFSVGNSGGNRLTWDGTNLNVVGGGTFSGALSAATGTFSGALSAASGTFAGSLQAATGSFSGSLNAASGTFSGALSAASGTFSGSLTANALNAVNTVNIAGNSVTVSNSTQGLDPSTSLYVPAGQLMKITSIAYSPSFSTGGSIVRKRTIRHTLNGVTSKENAGWYSGGENNYMSDSIISVKYATVTGPATVSASLTGDGLYGYALGVITIFGSMR